MPEISNEQMQQMNEAQQVKKAIKSSNADVSFKEEVLNQDKYKEAIIDSLLGIRRLRVPEKNNDGEVVALKEFVRVEEPKGTWKRVDKMSDDEWNDLKKSGGVLTEEGVEKVTMHLNSLSNNNISLSNLEEDQIKNLAIKTQKEIALTLQKDPERYGINDPQVLKEICTSVILPNVLGSLQKAENGKWVKELLRNTNAVANLDEAEDESSNLGGLGDLL